MVDTKKMVTNNSLLKRLEDSKNPVLGPNLKAFYLMGFLPSGGNIHRILCSILFLLDTLFVVTQVIELWTLRNDFIGTMDNISVLALSFITVVKANSYIYARPYWQTLNELISAEELKAIENKDEVALKVMKTYTQRARFITYLYWTLVILTNIVMLIEPVTSYFSAEEDKNHPLLFSSWFPFDKTKSPGYFAAFAVQLYIDIHGGGIVAVYDSMAMVIMIFLKGQITVLREKCKRFFNEKGVLSDREIMFRIKELHRHHNCLIKQTTLFNSLLSPVMFLYVLVCSINICCSVVQLNSAEAPASQKLRVIEFTTALISQIFLYCWHSNDIAVECNELDRSLYQSEWWKADVRTRKLFILLTGKLRKTFILTAGPFTTLSVSTFIEIMKGTYSFFTLFTKMQEK